ncbi:hypothetical protein ABPG73_021218 [Tetrahymena malaccensis]
MNYQIISLIVLCAIQICFCTQCQSNEIYSLIAQSCLQCSQQCSSCFSTNESACISCDANLFKSSDNSSTCVKKCSNEEFLNQNLECVRCQVYGCIKCDTNQICLQCDQHLQIDLLNNQCILMNNTCPFQTNFIQGPSNLKQCTQECSQSYYQNMEAQICQETIKCIQIEESSRFSFDQRVQQIQSINENQYLVEGNACTFALVDNNWKVINIQILQNITDYNYQYTSFGAEVNKKSFIIGNQGGCTAGSRLVVMDFNTFEIIIDSNTYYDYYFQYADQKNQIVFLLSYVTNTLLWYDAVNKSFNQSQINTSTCQLLFQIEINNSTNYIIQSYDFQLQIGTLNEQRQLLFKNLKQLNLDYFIFIDVKQFNDYFILISDSLNYKFQVIKIDIQQDQISLIKVIEQFPGIQQTQHQTIYYLNTLNSIIMQNTDSHILEMLVLNYQSDQVVSKLNLTSTQISSFQVFEDAPSNSIMVFIFSESLQIMNLTSYLISFNQGFPQKFQNQFKPLNQNYISNKSKITNLIINMDQNIMDVFITQIFSQYTAYLQQIRLRYNLTDFAFQIQYLNPYQFGIFYYDDYLYTSSNQFIFTSKDKSNKNLFLIFDSQQTFVNQTIGYVAIYESIQNFQKIPKISTKIINLNQNTFTTLETYQFISQISNQYILIQQSIDQIEYYYVIDIDQEKQILSYNYTYQYQDPIYFYFQEKNLLFVQNIPQIFNLSNSQQLINDDQTQFLSLSSYVIINQDYIVYQSINSQSELILYLLDLSTLQSTLLFNFQQNQINSFWTIDNTLYYPVIFNNDIIYFCYTDQIPICQPFSLNAQNFIMEATQLQLFPNNNPTVTYQKTKEIFIFYSGIIQIYSFDLKQQTQLNLGIQYLTNYYNTQQAIFQTERYVFYFDLTYFYKFDMELKQYEYLEAETLNFQNYQQLINFYILNSTSYIKKSGQIIDTENMIIIKTQQEDNYFIGQIQMDDTQLHIFSQANEVYWHKNILNMPFYILNFTSSQTLQDIYFKKGQSLIALYDSSCQCVLIYDFIKNIQQESQVMFNAQFDLKIKLIDWKNYNFIYVIGSSLYLYNPNKSEKQQQLGLLDSNIIELQYCYQQQIAVAITQKQNLFIIKVQEQVSSKVETNFNYLNDQIVLQLKFSLKCSENILIIYSPVAQIINLLTEGDQQPFQNFNQQQIPNFAQSIPIVNVKEKLLIFQFNIQNIYFQRNDFNTYLSFFDYRQNNTIMHYDIKNNILIGITGVIKKVSIMIIPGDLVLFTYYTINSFLKGATFYFEDQTSLILIDTTPIIYLINYIQQINQQESNWWKIPFEDNKRFNTKDWINKTQFTNNIFILQKKDNGSNILILDLFSRDFKYQKSVNNWSVVNHVNDPFKQLIYVISNEATTSVFSYSLEFITSIANPCLKQAIISFDQNFVYSICPNDIINIKIFQSNQTHIVQIKEQDINTVQYLSDYAMLKDLEIYNCVDTIFSFQTNTFEFSNLRIELLQVSQIVFNIQASQINITNLNITNTKYLFTKIDANLISIIGFTNFQIVNINSNSNQISLFSIKEQKNVGYGLISQAKLMNFFISNQNPLILLNQLSIVELKNILIKNVINANSSYISIIVIQNCDSVTISESKFINNTNSKGPGGVIYALENRQIKIQNSVFWLNTCKLQNGGALFMINTIQQGVLLVNQTQFIKNKSDYSSGGSIYLQNNNLIMQNSVLASNQAQIGGGIYYVQMMPDFLADLQQGNKNNNTFKDNLAQIYGQNIGSTLRKISINLENIKIPKTSIKSQQNSTIFIKKFKSGDQINFQQIQLLDEEDNPIKFMDVNSTNFYLLSSDVQSTVQQISVSLSWDQENKEIQCIGQLQTKQFINGGFDLDTQVFYKPISDMILKIVSNSFPSIKDSKGNIIINSGQIELILNLQLEQCSVGQIFKQYGNSISCEQCPDGKYSLSINDKECKQCPDSAINCIGSDIQLKNGYWRENENTDNIIYCSFNPLSCEPQLSTSKFYCSEGYKGPLCYQCDTYGDVWGNRYSEILNPGFCYMCEKNMAKIIIYNLLLYLVISLYIFIILKRIIIQLEVKVKGYYLNRLGIIYLGSTLNQSDRSQIISKILTDHLQMLSLVCSFTEKLPALFTLPIQLSGNPVSISSKSIDCIFSNFPKLQPLWLFESLWSFSLPVGIFIFYILKGIILKQFKIDIFIRYLQTAAIFIYFYFYPMIITLTSRSINCITIGDKKYLDLDLNVQCYDKNQHKPYIFLYSIPAIFIWSVLIPLFLFYKIYDAKSKKKSIIKQIKYSFLFAGYKEQYYYWEFWKLFYKTTLILISVLLKQNIYLKVKQKYPQLLDVQIQNPQKISSLLKLKKVKERIKQMMKDFKKKDIYSKGLELFNLSKQKQQDFILSPPSHKMNLTAQSEINDEQQCVFKNKNSIKRLKNKWSYYTRNTKINQTSLKDKKFDRPSLLNSNTKDNYTQETENSIQNNYNFNSDHKFQIQLTQDKN